MNTVTRATMSGILIRAATPEDAPSVSALIFSLADYFLADPADSAAAAAFFETITPAAIADSLRSGRFRYHLATEGDRLVGVVGVRDDSHLFHLFVAEPFHRRGIAARLWAEAQAAARARGNPGRFTVNSSLYALPLYRRFGFVEVGPRVVKDGIAFVPMELSGG